ncbi:hypothetical protein ABZ054_19055, partial [Streptomyces sp. NPDC006324]
MDDRPGGPVEPEGPGVETRAEQHHLTHARPGGRRQVVVQDAGPQPEVPAEPAPQRVRGTAGDLVGTTAPVPAGELGPLPAWLVPAPRTTWVIALHGLGVTREH